MQWEGREESSNVENETSSGGGGGFGGFGGRGLAVGGGVGGVIIIIIALLLGVDPRNFFGPGGPNPAVNQPAGPPDAEIEKLRHFSAVVFRDTEIVWDKLFKEMGKTYRKPILHTFIDSTKSGCGFADAAVGPFYCPADEKVYIDLTFYYDMEQKLKIPGEFPRAYVLAHEVGHHVQHLLGYSKRVEEGGEDKNRMSVRLELQADYLAGVWAHHAAEQFKNYIEKGDVESAITAAWQIGDDTLQKRAGRSVRPEMFTHGKSAQRAKWFKEGFKSGSVKDAAKLFELKYEQL